MSRSTKQVGRRCRDAHRVWPRWLLLLPLLAVACGGAEPQTPPVPANVVLISIDALRADRLNCYGYRDRTVSPNVDALAQDGVLFENHISSSPWTTPAHLSMLTSLHPSSHGVIRPFVEIKDDLRKGRLFEKLPESRTTLAEALASRGFATAAFTAGLTLSPRIGFGQGFSRYESTMFKLDGENMAEVKTWVAERRSTPFFLFWHTFEVHAPYLQRAFLPEVLSEDEVRAVGEALDAHARARQQGLVGGYGLVKILKRHGVFTREVCEALYMGCVLSMDRWVGELVDALRQLGVYDRTLIVFTSDHGEELGQRSPGRIYDGHGHTLYEELLRVPLIVKLPGQRQGGKRVEQVTSVVDIMPTILDTLSFPGPVEMQGRCLRPLWEDQPNQGEAVAYAEALGEAVEKKVVRAGRYKYILSMDAETVALHGRRHVPAEPAGRELFDLVEDPEERHNLLDSLRRGHFPGLAERLDADLRAHLARQRGEVEQTDLNPETIEKLKLLGYVQ